MKHASLSQTVGTIKRYKPKANLLPGQQFADHVTGERGREAIISPLSFHADTPHELNIAASTASSSSNAASSSTADAAKAIMDPSNTINPTIRTYQAQYNDIVNKTSNPHFSIPFGNLFGSFVQARHGEVRALLSHPGAPAPYEFLENLCSISYPTFTCFRDCIICELERGDRHNGNGSVRIWNLYKRCEHLHGPTVDATYEIVDLMIRALVSVSAMEAVVEALDRIPNDHIRPHTWDMLLVAIAKRKMRSAELLWRLVGPDSFHVLPTTGQFGLSAEFATVLLTRTKVQGYSFAPPLVGKAIMARYVQFCAATQIPLHPTPFLFFFKLIRDARAGSDSTLFHWHIVWEYFQKLNAECPVWYERFPEEAEQLCGFVIDIMIRGADPWMVLNVSRSIASRRIMDGFDLSLRILRRLEPYQHHPAETKAVAKKLFTWLLEVVQIHLNPRYQSQIIPAMQVLIRLGLLSELSRFHNHLLDHVVSLPDSLKKDFFAAFQDILCPSCNSLLESTDCTVDRQCAYCQTVKVASKRGLVQQGPSYTTTSTSSTAGLLDSASVAMNPSVMDSMVIDITASVRVAEKEKGAPSIASQSSTAAAMAAVAHSSNPTSGGDAGPLGLVSFRRSAKAANDSLPHTGATTGSMWRNAKAQREEEQRKMLGFVERLQREQPTRKGFIDLAKNQLSVDGRSFDSDAPPTTAPPHSRGKTPAVGSFVPAVEEGGADGLRTKPEQNVRATLEDADGRSELRMQAKRMILNQSGGPSINTTEGVQTTSSDASAGDQSPTASLPPFVVTEVSGADSSNTKVPSKLSERTQQQQQEQRKRTTAKEWTCVWCQEKNVTATSQTQCGACGAETGPDASWRTFSYAAAQTEDEAGAAKQVMDEIRQRILHCYDNPNDGVVGAYYLMLYRRLFLMRATQSDFALVEQLVASLAASHERVLAGFVYVRLLPSALRRLNSPALQRLATLYGTIGSKEYSSLTQEELANDGHVAAKVLGTSTCKVCYGTHDWRICPIVTRDFRLISSRVRLTPEEQHRWVMESITRSIKVAQQLSAEAKATEATSQAEASDSGSPSIPTPQTAAISAYKLFVSFKRREDWAVLNPTEANQLAQLLADCGEMTRASFVLCHIPLHCREDATYLKVTTHFGVEKSDAEVVLARRSRGRLADQTHPNFVQVTLTCCMCLEGKHASYNCPNLKKWAAALAEVHSKQPGASGDAKKRFELGPELQTLKAQVDGWTFSGPERLHAFYRFLLTNMEQFDTLASPGDHFNSPIYHAINATICRLVETGRRSNAWRLLARSPVRLLNIKKSLVAVLRMNGVDGHTLKQVAESSTTAALWLREAALPVHTHCLICFDPSHGFQQCPELVGRESSIEKLDVMLTHVGGIRCTRIGVTAAADHAIDSHRRCEFTSRDLKMNPQVAKRVAALANQCFASSEVARGRKLLQLLPPEMIELGLLQSYWKAAGIPEANIEVMCDAMEEFYSLHKFQPSVAAPPVFEKPELFNVQFRKLQDAGSCKCCGEYGHTVSKCLLYRNEASFSRDVIAVFRNVLMSETMSASAVKTIIVRYAKFLILYHRHLPYEFVGVQRAVNSVAAFNAMINEPGIALRLLLTIPAAYREKSPFENIFCALGFNRDEVDQRLAKLESRSSTRENPDMAISLAATNRKSPILDDALGKIFSDQSSLLSALRISDEVILSFTDPSVVERESRRRSNLLTDPNSSLNTGNVPVADALSRLPPLSIRPVQFADVINYREAFDASIQSPVESFLGRKIGSKHEIYSMEMVGVADETPQPLKAKRDDVTEAIPVPVRDPRPPRDSNNSSAAKQTSDNRQADTANSRTFRRDHQHPASRGKSSSQERDNVGGNNGSRRRDEYSRVDHSRDRRDDRRTHNSDASRRGDEGAMRNSGDADRRPESSSSYRHGKHYDRNRNSQPADRRSQYKGNSGRRSSD